MRDKQLVFLAAGLLMTACGTERVVPGAEAIDTGTPTPTATAPASPTPTTDGLDGFPLALGYDGENGDDRSLVRITDNPATKAFELCGVAAWDPDAAGISDLLGVAWRGEAEWSRGRTLVHYETPEAAAAAVAATRDAVAGCPDEPAEADYGTTHTLLDIELGDDSVAWTDTYWSGFEGQKLHDTGLTVHHLVRVGRVVLLAYEYGEGNGSEATRTSAIQRATELERPVVAAMADVG